MTPGNISPECAEEIRTIVASIINDINSLRDVRKEAGLPEDPLSDHVAKGASLVLASHLAALTGETNDVNLASQLDAVYSESKEQIASHLYPNVDVYLRKLIDARLNTCTQDEQGTRAVAGLVEIGAIAQVLVYLTGKPEDVQLLKEVTSLIEIGLINVTGGPPPDNTKVTLS